MIITIRGKMQIIIIKVRKINSNKNSNIIIKSDSQWNSNNGNY